MKPTHYMVVNKWIMDEKNGKVGLPSLILIVGLGIVVLFTWLFAELSEELLEKELQSFDRSIINFFEAVSSRTLDNIYIVITELGSVGFLTILSVITILFLWFKVKDKWGVLFFIIAIGGSGLLTSVLKRVYGRSRPSINEAIDATGFSFPSGHSLGSLVFYGFIAYLVVRSSQRRMVKISALVMSGMLIILIGTSRIYLGAHFPSDVVAGYIAGTIWLILCLMVLEWLQWQRNSDVRPVHALRNFLKSTYRKGRQKIRR